MSLKCPLISSCFLLISSSLISSSHIYRGNALRLKNSKYSAPSGSLTEIHCELLQVHQKKREKNATFPVTSEKRTNFNFYKTVKFRLSRGCIEAPVCHRKVMRMVSLLLFNDKGFSVVSNKINCLV